MMNGCLLGDWGILSHEGWVVKGFFLSFYKIIKIHFVKTIIPLLD